MLLLDKPDTLESATNQRDLLAEAMYGTLVRLGVINPDVPCDGPSLLMFTEEHNQHLDSPPDDALTFG
jgi:hypothetical protein